MTLTFNSVINNNWDLEYTIPENVGKRYEELTSFSRGRDFNREIKEYMISFVEEFQPFMNLDNEKALNDRLIAYNNLVVNLRKQILQATTIPSVLISGGSNYPIKKKERELERIHILEGELYSKYGKHERFLENTRSMFDPVLIEQREKTKTMRKERAAEKHWIDFYKQIDHDELSGYGIDLEAQRIYITTYEKPSESTRKAFKKAALRWSPKNKRWQRILTMNAIHSISRNIFEELDLKIGISDFQSNIEE